MMLDEFIWGKGAPDLAGSSRSRCRGCHARAITLAAQATSPPISARSARTPFRWGLSVTTMLPRVCRSSLRDQGIEPSGLVSEAGRPTTVKTRIVAHNQQIVRADRENKTPLSEERNTALLAAFVKWLPSCAAVIVSDYDKGVVNRQLLSQRTSCSSRRAGFRCFWTPRFTRRITTGPLP